MPLFLSPTAAKLQNKVYRLCTQCPSSDPFKPSWPWATEVVSTPAQSLPQDCLLTPSASGVLSWTAPFPGLSSKCSPLPQDCPLQNCSFHKGNNGLGNTRVTTLGWGHRSRDPGEAQWWTLSSGGSGQTAVPLGPAHQSSASSLFLALLTWPCRGLGLLEPQKQSWWGLF